MQKIIITSLALAFLSTSAVARDSYYGKGLIGFGYVPSQKASNLTVPNNIKTKGRGAFGILGIGYNFGNTNVRSDLEFYFDNGLRGKKNVNSQKLETMAGFLNFYYDFRSQSKLTPFVMGGVGYAKNKYKFNDASYSYSKNKNGFAYKVGLGLAYKVMLSLDIEGSYFYMDKGAKKVTVSHSGGSTYHLKSSGSRVHAFAIGPRINF